MIYGRFDSVTAKPYVTVAVQVHPASRRLNIDFLIDTGASDIVLCHADASRLGILSSLPGSLVATHGLAVP